MVSEARVVLPEKVTVPLALPVLSWRLRLYPLPLIGPLKLMALASAFTTMLLLRLMEPDPGLIVIGLEVEEGEAVLAVMLPPIRILPFWPVLLARVIAPVALSEPPFAISIEAPVAAPNGLPAPKLDPFRTRLPVAVTEPPEPIYTPPVPVLLMSPVKVRLLELFKEPVICM